MKEAKEFLRALNPQSITFIGESSQKFEPLIYSELDAESITTVFLDPKSTTVIPKSDLSIWINFEPRAKRDLNLDLLKNLTDNSSNIIFASRVPCYATKAAFFWPSYWCDVFEELGFDNSNLLKSMLWYDSLLTPFELEGLLFFKKKTTEGLNLSSAEILDQLHPQHGCNHFIQGSGTRFFFLRVLPKKIYLGKQHFILKRVKKLYILNKPLKTQVIETNGISALSDKREQSKSDGYHPGHGCRHKDLYGESPSIVKTFLLARLTYSRRQKIKSVLPSSLISWAKRMLLR